jgi:hypothetical protein
VPPSPCLVLIASPEFLHSIAERVDPGGGELITFTDTDALQALRTITERRPSVVVLEKQFSATSRGAALIDRLKADPHLTTCEIRIVERDGITEVVPSPRLTQDESAQLDRWGTRRSPRYPVDELVEVLIDGQMAAVVNLSSEGAQLVSANVLKPNQRVLVSLSDGEDVLRFNAAVAWSSFEIPRTGGPRYRAGLEFLDANPDALNAYSRRHRTP